VNRGHALHVVGAVLLATPLWLGVVLPHQPVHGYETHPVTATADSLEVDSGTAVPLAGVTCSTSQDWACQFVSRVQTEGSVRIDGPPPFAADEYAFGDYAWQLEDVENGTVVSLDPVSPETVLAGIARTPSPELEAALESGRVSADYDVQPEHVVYETSEGYRVVGNQYTDDGAANQNELREALSKVGMVLGLGVVLRGQRRRVEAESSAA
jgi:hypothetical protein